jgi:cyclic pyranopterin phosphate synthase
MASGRSSGDLNIEGISVTTNKPSTFFSAGKEHSPLQDPFGRKVDYLRISVTDRCNERCLYCMPEGYKGWAQKQDHMTAREIITAVEAATRLGFRKFRITGGEPLLRSDLVEICRGIWELPGVQTLGVSTNATLLERLAKPLREAGVRSLNISLDALDPLRYQRLTGGKVDRVLTGIKEASRAGFEIIKLNSVLLRGESENEILPLVHFAGKNAMPIRFIELMPLSRAGGMEDPRFLPVGEIMKILQAAGELVPLVDYRPGHGPARYFEFRPLAAKVGFVGAMTQEHFCASCNKVRLTADGKIRPCLGRHGEVDLLASMRGASDPESAARLALRQAVAAKPENHEFLAGFEPGRPMTAIGG